MDNSKLFGVEGKTALVTGSAQGLGREIALGLAQNGASLILADIVQPDETAGAIEALGSRAVSIQTDITDEAAVMSLAESCSVSEYGPVDILVNNAGVSQLSYIPTEDLPVDEWDRIIRVNLRGTFLCCKHIGKQMIKNNGGSIINVATTAGITGVARAPAYCASKAGVILLTKSLALEWARYNVRVNAISPHYLETELTKELRGSGKIYRGLIKEIPLKRFGQPSEMLGVVLLLASDSSSYMTGSVIVADGGYLAR